MNTERRQQRRRHDDVFPVDLVNQAARHVLAQGGVEIQKVDGVFVKITVTPLTAGDAQEMREASRREANHDDSPMGTTQ